MAAPLVFDIGMNDGTDSAYYLRRGCRVVAVEANPLLVEESKQRFGREVDEGQFAVVNVGIAEGEGEAEFWVCDDWTPWSSFDREGASRNGSRHHAERVQLKPMSAIVAEFGIPHYCKIDIEGYDKYCLDGLSFDDHPQFLSVEFSLDFPFAERMRELGYERFKLIHQLSFCSASTGWYSARTHVPNERVQAGLERLHGGVRGALNDGRWYFKVGSSGPMPEDTPGRWLSYQEVLDLRSYLAERYADGRMGPLDCFDLHATTAGIAA